MRILGMLTGQRRAGSPCAARVTRGLHTLGTDMCLSGGGNLEAHGDSICRQRTAGRVTGLLILLFLAPVLLPYGVMLLLLLLMLYFPFTSHLSPGRAEVMVLAHSTGLARKLEVPWLVRLCHPISCFYASRMVHALAGSAPVAVLPCIPFFRDHPVTGRCCPWSDLDSRGFALVAVDPPNLINWRPSHPLDLQCCALSQSSPVSC